MDSETGLDPPDVKLRSNSVSRRHHQTHALPRPEKKLTVLQRGVSTPRSRFLGLRCDLPSVLDTPRQALTTSNIS